jgi:MerR family transcriptional regulator, copper efflux regulator
MDGLSVGRAAAHSGWSARMLRYLEHAGLVVPSRSASGYRLYGIRELNQLRGLADLRRRFGVELDEVAFALRLRREPTVRAAVETWLMGTNVATAEASAPAWVEWEQRKHEKLLAA